MKYFIFLFITGLASGFSCRKYDRAKEFGGWKDADRDGQNTRVEVLIEESAAPVTFTNAKEAAIEAGEWISPYSDSGFTDPKMLDIDHLVPLKEAYESGAWRWTRDRRIAYANYLKRENHLLAVDAALNRAKGDKDPAQWLDVVPAYRKQYVRDWCDVKARWGLTADTAEVGAITQVLGRKSAKVWLKNVKVAEETHCAG